jgi:hypothetical protein
MLKRLTAGGAGAGRPESSDYPIENPPEWLTSPQNHEPIRRCPDNSRQPLRNKKTGLAAGFLIALS